MAWPDGYLTLFINVYGTVICELKGHSMYKEITSLSALKHKISTNISNSQKAKKAVFKRAQHLAKCSV